MQIKYTEVAFFMYSDWQNSKVIQYLMFSANLYSSGRQCSSKTLNVYTFYTPVSFLGIYSTDGLP